MDIFELEHVMKPHKFIFPGKFHIENESKVGEINIEVRNRTELNQWGMYRKCIKSKNMGFDSALVQYSLNLIRQWIYPKCDKRLNSKTTVYVDVFQKLLN